MEIKLVLGDITRIKVEAIVNAANSSLLGGGGVDGAIHRAAGKQLLEECRQLNGCRTGEAKLTKGYNLYADFIIHTVGPVWNGGGKGEVDFLKSCYFNSLKIASRRGIKSMAYPCISTGRFRFPINQAAAIAVDSVRKYSEADDNIKEIYFVCYDKQNYNEYAKLLPLEQL